MSVTFALCEVARVVEQKITEGVAFVIDGGLSAQARRLEERERLKGFQSRPALDHRICRTRNCEHTGKRVSIIKVLDKKKINKNSITSRKQRMTVQTRLRDTETLCTTRGLRGEWIWSLDPQTHTR